MKAQLTTQSIRISKGLIKQLNDYKEHKRETYEDVIVRAICGLKYMKDHESMKKKVENEN